MRSLPALSAVAAAILLGACGGSSSGPRTGAATPESSAQAIDGYLVGSSVFCDDVERGGTAKAGRFTCPLGTELFGIVGGTDVGFDVDATTGIEFLGSLKAPATLSYVTPLSTVAMEMSAGEDGEFDETMFADAVENLAMALGTSALDLNADASSVMELVRLNAQINTLISEFVVAAEDYGVVTKTFASLVSEAASKGEAYNLADGVEDIVTRVNTRLADDNSPLRKSAAELSETIARVQVANKAVQEAQDAKGVSGAVVAAASSASAVTIDRDLAFVNLSDESGAVVGVSLAGFQSSALSNGAYGTILDGDTSRLEIGADAFTVGRTVDDKTVSLGFALVATRSGDKRRMTVTTDAAKFSTVKADGSMMVTLPKDSKLNIRSVNAAGTAKDASIMLKKEHEFSSANEGIDISFWDIDERLDEKGYGDLTAEGGNYRLTAVIGGVRITESVGGSVQRAIQRTVETDKQTVTGVGFQGYVTFVPASAP